MSKIRVGILFGGKSAEHEVSLQSAKNIVEALDKEKFEPVLIGIDKKGVWHLNDSRTYLKNADNASQIALGVSVQDIALLPGDEQDRLVDVVFPVLHGPLGEDGTVQGLLKLADVPFVGADVLGSAIGMDKDIMKRLLRDAHLPIAPFLVFSAQQVSAISYKEVIKHLGLPCFVKPANMGSSVGVSKVTDVQTFAGAISKAFQYDAKILIEQFVDGIEVECAILGNQDPIASLPGKIIPHAEFYSYEAKYIDENGAKVEIPAKLSDVMVKKIQETALTTFKVLNCEGLARVDMFITKSDKIVINEINTIPGFTSISMYPKLWEASGIPYQELITRLLELAIERHAAQKKLKTSFR